MNQTRSLSGTRKTCKPAASPTNYHLPGGECREMKLETMKAILGDMAVAALMRLVCCRLQLARLRQPSCPPRDHKAREEFLEFQKSGCDRLRPGTVVPCRGDVSLVSFKVDLHKVTHNRCATLRLYRLDCAPRRPPSAHVHATSNR